TTSKYAYVWANNATSASYTPSPDHQFNSTGGTNTITRTATGAYSVRLPGLGKFAGTAKVSAFGTTGNTCKLSSWGPDVNKVDQIVYVLCYDTSGNPVDMQFTMTYATKMGIFATGSNPNGYVYANKSTSSFYTPNKTYQHNSTGATNTITRTGTGRYTVT